MNFSALRFILTILTIFAVGLLPFSIRAQEGAPEPAGVDASAERERAKRILDDSRAALSEREIDQTAKGERILHFHSEIVIGRDGILDVEETIVVRVTGRGVIKRGILRDFPTIYGKEEVPFELVNVQLDGVDERSVLEDVKGGRRVRIGRGAIILKPGIYEYRIRYRTGRQLGDFETHDELYWNVTGTEWAFPIDAATAAVSLPSGVEATSHEGYTGRRGSTATDLESEVLTDGRVAFRTTRRLGKNEGLTAVVTFPKGAVDHGLHHVSWFGANWPLVGALGSLLAALVYFVCQWLRVGVDPEPGTIIPRYEPPDGFSPPACRYLMEQGFDANCFSSGVIDLAVRGLVTIEKKAGTDYVLHGTGAPVPDDLPTDERQLLGNLALDSGPLALRQSNHRRIQRARSAIFVNLADRMENVLFRKNVMIWIPGFLLSLLPILFAVLSARNPGEPAALGVFLSFWSFGVAMILAGAIGAFRDRNTRQGMSMSLFSIPFVLAWCAVAYFFFSKIGSWVFLPVVLVGPVLAIVFKHLIKAPSAEGRQLMDEIEGFKEYLSVAEEDRLNLQNPPEETPELFERFLPYAHALGCDQQWSDRFESVLAAAGSASQGRGGGYRPGWYSGMDGRDLAGGAFGAALGTAMASTLSSAGASPGSSSGSGGGGFSGGGGGGGGGGGW